MMKHHMHHVRQNRHHAHLADHLLSYKINTLPDCNKHMNNTQHPMFIVDRKDHAITILKELNFTSTVNMLENLKTPVDLCATAQTPTLAYICNVTLGLRDFFNAQSIFGMQKNLTTDELHAFRGSFFSQVISPRLTGKYNSTWNTTFPRFNATGRAIFSRMGARLSERPIVTHLMPAGLAAFRSIPMAIAEFDIADAVMKLVPKKSTRTRVLNVVTSGIPRFIATVRKLIENLDAQHYHYKQVARHVDEQADSLTLHQLAHLFGKNTFRRSEAYHRINHHNATLLMGRIERWKGPGTADNTFDLARPLDYVYGVGYLTCWLFPININGVRCFNSTGCNPGFPYLMIQTAQCQYPHFIATPIHFFPAGFDTANPGCGPYANIVTSLRAILYIPGTPIFGPILQRHPGWSLVFGFLVLNQTGGQGLAALPPNMIICTFANSWTIFTWGLIVGSVIIVVLMLIGAMQKCMGTILKRPEGASPGRMMSGAIATVRDSAYALADGVHSIVSIEPMSSDGLRQRKGLLKIE